MWETARKAAEGGSPSGAERDTKHGVGGKREGECRKRRGSHLKDRARIIKVLKGKRMRKGQSLKANGLGRTEPESRKLRKESMNL